MEQMTIFDFITVDTPSTLDDLPEIDMVQMISSAVGLDFKYRDELFGYVVKKREIEYTVKYSNYKQKDNKARFISCGYMKKTEGAGIPCDSVDEAIEFFKTARRKEVNHNE